MQFQDRLVSCLGLGTVPVRFGDRVLLGSVLPAGCECLGSGVFSLPDLGLVLLRELSGTHSVDCRNFDRSSVDCSDFDRSSGDRGNSADGIDFGFEICMGSLESELFEIGRNSLDESGLEVGRNSPESAEVGRDSLKSAEVGRDSPEPAEIDMDSADQPLDSTVSD